jgi:hypothetical protein
VKPIAFTPSNGARVDRVVSMPLTRYGPCKQCLQFHLQDFRASPEEAPQPPAALSKGIFQHYLSRKEGEVANASKEETRGRPAFAE